MATYEVCINWQIQDSLKRLARLAGSCRNRNIENRFERINNIFNSIKSIQSRLDKLTRRPNSSRYCDILHKLRKSLDRNVDAIEDLECEKCTGVVSYRPMDRKDPLVSVILQAR